MSEKEKQVMETLKKILPELPKSKQDYLLGYGDAIADLKKGDADNGSNDDSGNTGSD